MFVFRLSSFPIEQITDRDGLERRLGGGLAGLGFPVRLLAFSKQFDMRQPINTVRRDQADMERLRRLASPFLEAIDADLAGGQADPSLVLDQMPAEDAGALLGLFADEPALQAALADSGQLDRGSRDVLWASVGDALDSILWRLPWTKEMVRFYEALQHRHLRSAVYLLIAWPPADVSAQAVAATLRHATSRDVQILDALPSVLDGPYTEEGNRLRPEQPGTPWLAGLLSYDARGVWDATTLHGLLNVTYDVAVAIDIVTLSRNQAMRSAEMAYNAARVVARDAQVVDMRAGRVIASAERVMHELVHESLHTVQIGVLVGGATPEELETNIAETSSRLGSQLRMMRPAGAQGEVLKLWSPTPRNQIEAPLKPRTMLSHGVGCCAGLLGYHRASNTEGLFWGLDAMRRAPLFFDLFRNNQAAHMVILGKSGSGKTFLLNLLALRGAALMGYRVIGIDAFRNGERVEAAARAGARCHFLRLDNPINVLDIVYTDDDVEGGWVANQVQHVIGQLALLLGTPGRSADGKEQYIPRLLSIAERGVLDRALCALYAEVTPAAPLGEMPILSDLIAQLEQFAEPEARAVARELRMLIYGTDSPEATDLNALGRSFNAPTGMDWNFSLDINYYDVSGVPELLRPFYYVQIIGAILRYMRDPKRDRSRKTLLQIDEFGYLTQVEALARLAATICKVVSGGLRGG